MKLLPLFLLISTPGLAPAQQFDRDKAPPALPPAESQQAFTVPDDLEIDLVLSEPVVAQPLHLSFDARGRLWLAEYRQYPAPAGLKQVSRDKFWRSVYDKVPPAPPNHFRGKDRISIHEDTNGDGSFDSHKVFVDGLNIASAAAVGPDGVWVMNPPYLLFYPDHDGDDVPDADPDVHLSGFGLEDTHSVANSLRFGPDGWLYACQGSTVSGHIKVEPLPTDRAPVSTKTIHTLGQNIWRYHPGTRRYEVFAEGGGNAFGIEIDSAGRIFSGHNGGDTRGFHYVQGGYLRKGFQKHGELSNPFAFGHFPQMKSNRVARFTHTFLVNEANALPERYRGKLFALESLQGRVVLADITAKGSTFETRDIEHAVTTTDRWFRPVDVKSGPDGAIYIVDWHDFSVNHYRNYQGNMDATGGRIWRLRSKDARFAKTLDFSKLPSPTLLDLLAHPNRWVRETAVRQLVNRGDSSVLPGLEATLNAPERPATIPAFWAWHQLADPKTPRDRFLTHPSWQVRQWTVRFLGDPFPGQLDTGGSGPGPSVPSVDHNKIVDLASTEPNVEVRAQLAATARRLPADVAIPVIKALVLRDEDAKDSRQPLAIWWALEAKATTHPDSVIALFEEASLWDAPIVKDHLVERLMRRHAQAGSRDDLLVCARLFKLSPSKAHSKILMRGFEAAYEGRSMTGLPDALIEAMARHDVGSIAIGLRRSDPTALKEALAIIVDQKADTSTRQRIIRILGEIQADDCIPSLLKLAKQESNDTILQAVFVNPSAEIREGYENFLINTKDQRTLGGFIVEQDDRRVILRGFDGQNIVLPRDNITSINAAGMSLMPEALTNALDDQQIRDLFSYIRSSQPLNQ